MHRNTEDMNYSPIFLCMFVFFIIFAIFGAVLPAAAINCARLRGSVGASNHDGNSVIVLKSIEFITCLWWPSVPWLCIFVYIPWRTMAKRTMAAVYHCQAYLGQAYHGQAYHGFVLWWPSVPWLSIPWQLCIFVYIPGATGQQILG